MVSKEQLIQSAEEVKKLGNELAEVKSKFQNLNKIEKDILSKAMSEVDKLMSGKVSEAKLERYARVTEEWGNYQVGLNNSRDAYLKAEAKYTSATIYHETLRSILSLEKTEMSIL